MPTNRLWLEHTERAAWDSVQALREKLAAAEERLQRFTPVRESWQSIVAALDRARSDFNIQKERYSEVAHAVVEALHDAREDRDRLAAEIEKARHSSPALAVHVPREPMHRSPGDFQNIVPDADVSGDAAGAVEAILEQYEIDARALTGKRKLALARKALERRLEELEEIDDGSASELAELAVRIGALALRLLTLSRAELDKKRFSGRVEDDDE